jgi:acyl-CoA synthetase (AMP-forming)/AMP-acid ligase II
VYDVDATVISKNDGRIAMSSRNVMRSIAILLGCLILAFVVAAVVDIARPGTFLRGRNFTRVALLASILIAVAALLRPKQQLRATQMVAELIVAECVIAALIWFFAGAITFDPFFISWWLGISAYVMLPWMVFSAVRSSIATR